MPDPKPAQSAHARPTSAHPRIPTLPKPRLATYHHDRAATQTSTGENRLGEKFLQIQTDDGVMETFVAYPKEGGPSPVVVLYMDAPGIREELYGFARRIAAQGYYCLLPDLYYRAGRIRFDLSTMTAEDGREMFAQMRSLSNAKIISDTEGLLAALKSESLAADGPKGCLGYCMSGQYIMSVAGTFPDDFRASISCYGVGIVSDQPDTPHRLAGKVQGEMFFAFAETDE